MKYQTMRTFTLAGLDGHRLSQCAGAEAAKEAKANELIERAELGADIARLNE
jgi:hypothetical protein